MRIRGRRTKKVHLVHGLDVSERYGKRGGARRLEPLTRCASFVQGPAGSDGKSGGSTLLSGGAKLATVSMTRR